MGAGEVVQGLKPVAAMVVVQVVFAGVNIFYKLAVVCDGMDMRVLVAYRYLFASAVLAPLAYFVERSLPNIIPSSLLFSSFLETIIDRVVCIIQYISTTSSIQRYQYFFIIFPKIKYLPFCITSLE